MPFYLYGSPSWTYDDTIPRATHSFILGSGHVRNIAWIIKETGSKKAALDYLVERLLTYPYPSCREIVLHATNLTLSPSRPWSIRPDLEIRDASFDITLTQIEIKEILAWHRKSIRADTTGKMQRAPKRANPQAIITKWTK